MTTLPETPTADVESEADERKRLLDDIEEMEGGFTSGFEEPAPPPVTPQPEEPFF